MKKDMFRKCMKVLLVGTLHALKGTLAVVCFAGGIALCCCVAKVNGYAAVGLFAAALLCFGLAGLVFYRCGCDMGKGKFSK